MQRELMQSLVPQSSLIPLFLFVTTCENYNNCVSETVSRERDGRVRGRQLYYGLLAPRHQTGTLQGKLSWLSWLTVQHRLQGLLSLAHAAEHEVLKPDFVGSWSHGLKRAASDQLSLASGRSLKSIAFILRWLHNFNQVPLLCLFSLVLCLAGHALHSLVHWLAGRKGQLSLVHWKAGHFKC
jgi:hypothetical protein